MSRIKDSLLKLFPDYLFGGVGQGGSGFDLEP